MRKIDSRTYVGEPGEIVTITTTVGGSGAAAQVSVGGVEMGSSATFPVPDTPGGEIKWEVVLSGPLGSLCVVTIADVELPKGVDEDFLICQTHNPRPVHFFTAAVASVGAVRSLTRTRAPRASRSPRRKVVRRSSAKKRATKVAAGRRKATKRTTKKGGRR